MFPKSNLVFGKKTYFGIHIIISFDYSQNESRKARLEHIKAKIKTAMLQVTLVKCFTNYVSH